MAGRIANALRAAAKLLEPKVGAVAVEKTLLKTAEDVRQWVARQKKKLLEAINNGPVQVQSDMATLSRDLRRQLERTWLRREQLRKLALSNLCIALLLNFRVRMTR